MATSERVFRPIRAHMGWVEPLALLPWCTVRCSSEQHQLVPPALEKIAADGLVIFWCNPTSNLHLSEVAKLLIEIRRRHLGFPPCRAG